MDFSTVEINQTIAEKFSRIDQWMSYWFYNRGVRGKLRKYDNTSDKIL